MIRRLRFIGLLGPAIVGLLALFLWSVPAAADGGVLEGQLRNGTSGAAVPAGLDVTLTATGTTGVNDAIQKSTVDAQGVFRFASIDTTTGYTYTVTATYQEVKYTSAPVTFAAADTTKQVGLTVYETTESDTAVTVEVAHTVLEPDPQNQALWAIEAAVIVNNGDRTYVGNRQRLVNDKRVTVLFSWPEGSGHLQPMQGLDPDSLVEVANGFGDTTPLLPGKHDVGYTYMLPIQNGAVGFARALDYPTRRFTALVVDVGGRIDGGTLAKGEPADVDGKRYQVFTGQNLTPGTPIRLSLSGITASQKTSTNMLILGGIVVALATVGGLVLYVWRRRSAGIAGRPSVVDRERLLTDLAKLDDSFEAGEIDEEEYEAARAARKRRLAELWQVRAEV